MRGEGGSRCRCWAVGQREREGLDRAEAGSVGCMCAQKMPRWRIVQQSLYMGSMGRRERILKPTLPISVLRKSIAWFFYTFPFRDTIVFRRGVQSDGRSYSLRGGQHRNFRTDLFPAFWLVSGRRDLAISLIWPARSFGESAQETRYFPFRSLVPLRPWK